jgi:hypothetical protein
VAYATFLGILAALVAATVLLPRRGAAAVATRRLGMEVERGDLRLLAGMAAAALVVLVVGVLLLDGTAGALGLLAVIGVSAVLTEVARRLWARPRVRAAVARAARTGGRRVADGATSLARRAGEVREARRR